MILRTKAGVISEGIGLSNGLLIVGNIVLIFSSHVSKTALLIDNIIIKIQFFLVKLCYSLFMFKTERG